MIATCQMKQVPSKERYLDPTFTRFMYNNTYPLPPSRSSIPVVNSGLPKLFPAGASSAPCIFGPDGSCLNPQILGVNGLRTTIHRMKNPSKILLTRQEFPLLNMIPISRCHYQQSSMQRRNTRSIVCGGHANGETSGPTGPGSRCI